MSRVRDLLVALLDATPPPPSADADPAEVLDTARQMIEDRRESFERLRVALESDPNALAGHQESARVAESLRVRDAAWAAALERARGAMRRRIAAVGAAQTYKRQGASRAR